MVVARCGIRSLSFRLVALSTVFSLFYFLYAYTHASDVYSFSLPQYLSPRPSCSPQSYSDGKWIYQPRTGNTNLTSQDDALQLSGFQGCASSREFYWHLAVDKPEQWDRFPGAHNWQWEPSQQCKDLREFQPEQLVKDLVEQGGWLLVGDSVTENHFFSISCLLYPHVLGSPNYTENPYFDRAWPQHLHLNPESPLIPYLSFPQDFNITTTPLVTFRRIDLLYSQKDLEDIYHSSNPSSPSDFQLFSNESVWTLSPTEYLDIFTTPLPQANYRTMVVSTAGHWTTTLFHGFRDEGKADKGYGIEGVLTFFENAMRQWAKEVQTALQRSEMEGKGKRRVVVRAYLPGHEDCHDHREPWSKIKPFVWNWYNWGSIWEFNKIFEASIGHII
ncbi:hypothetical protein AX17_001461 [Amanita inopinata Kibby_2008]|nr:hypothetical protein AX17_001461 [Amanita inopinata Kibby_2008]